MAVNWWILMAAIFIVFLVLYWTFNSVRFFSKMMLYGVCVVCSSTVGSICCIFNGRTTENHFIIFRTFQFFVSWMGLKVRVENKELLESDEPYVLIANHQTALDVYTMTFAWPKNCVVILKSSLKYVPGFNLCSYLCCSIFINRYNKTRAFQSIGDAEKAIVEKKRKIFIYPEGTRNASDEMLPFKKGAFVIAKTTNVPIVPCVFSSYKPFYNYAERKFEAGEIIVRVLPKVYPGDKSIQELVEECRQKMTDAFHDVNKSVASDVKKIE